MNWKNFMRGMLSIFYLDPPNRDILKRLENLKEKSFKDDSQALFEDWQKVFDTINWAYNEQIKKIDPKLVEHKLKEVLCDKNILN